MAKNKILQVIWVVTTMLIFVNSIAIAETYYWKENLRYTITSEDEGTVDLNSASRPNMRGHLNIPSEVELNNKSYSVSSIGYGAFSECSLLEFVSIPNSVKSIGACAFEACKGLKEVAIGESVSLIQASAFRECSNLVKLRIPDSVEKIESSAFMDSGLKQIVLSSSLKSIGYDAFYYTNLCSVVSLAAIPPVFEKNFGQGPFDKAISTLYVPSESVAIYKESEWSDFFTSIIALQKNLTLEIQGNGKVYTNDYEIALTGSKFNGDIFKFLIIPNSGHYISAITLDGEDVSANINEHNVWSISDFIGDGTLKIEFAPEKESSLIVNGTENHSLTLYYREGTQARIDIVPEDGWQLYTLSFNGEDVTKDVVDDTYITPALTGTNNLDIVMQSDISTNVDQIRDAQRKILFRKDGNTVEILNLEQHETIKIYNKEGYCEYQGLNRKVTLNPNNVYILKTEKETLKFIL